MSVVTTMTTTTYHASLLVRWLGSTQCQGSVVMGLERDGNELGNVVERVQEQINSCLSLCL